MYLNVWNACGFSGRLLVPGGYAPWYNPGMSDTRQKHLGRPWRFQYSIRSLLIATTIIAVMLSIGVPLYRKSEADARPGQFVQAVMSGNLMETNRLLRIDPQLAHGARLGHTSSYQTPLQMALVFGRNPKVVERILQERPDLEETSGDGETALHLVVKMQFLAETAELLRLGANANAATREGATPLHIAARGDPRGQMTKLLLEKGGDPNRVQSDRPGSDGKSPLHVAAESGNAAVVKLLLDADAEVNRRDTEGRTALHYSLSRNDFEISKLLIERGADLTAKDHADRIAGELGYSNSEVAALLWWEQVVKLHDQGKIAKLDAMLDAAPGALSFQTEYQSATMLHRAVAAKRLDLLNYLLGRHVDVDVHGNDGVTPLHYACSYPGTAGVVKRLLDAGANIEGRNQLGQTPLHVAAAAHNNEALQILIEKGANIGALDRAGAAVLDAAFERNFFLPNAQRAFDLLRNAGHPPTVLYAAATGDLQLLQKITGGNLAALDRGYTRNGIRPLHAAVFGRQLSVVRWLMDRGVNCEPHSAANCEPRPIDTPLMVALSYNIVDIALFLIEHGADVNCRSSSGHTPLHAVIAWERDPKILEALLTHDADPAFKCENKTALERAAKSQSQHRSRYLELLKREKGSKAKGAN